MKPVVAIFAQGTMGAGIAGVLTAHGVSVITALEGRSAESAKRAHAAGMEAVAFDQLAHADIVLSILPPVEALPFARRIAPSLTQAAHKSLFVDCNAVSPDTVRAIEAVIAETGAPFADIGIIGLPPGQAAPPRLYAAGAKLTQLSALNEFGLDIRPMEGPPGTASALKMAYAGITKGLIAVASSMILGASRAGVADALAAELNASEPQLFASLSRRIVDMTPKAHRWVAEMREISAFVRAEPGSAQMYQGAAALYEQLAKDAAGSHERSDALREFFSNEFAKSSRPTPLGVADALSNPRAQASGSR
jgi:3-hydroxyisobutyrate dehydrogenase-like beta-hydroxyacid dehydrogenase